MNLARVYQRDLGGELSTEVDSPVEGWVVVFLTGGVEKGYAGGVKNLTIKSEAHPSGVIVRIAGDAGVDHVEPLSGELKKISTKKPKLVVLDLSALDFIASLGMGELMGFRQAIAKGGGIVRVAGAQPMVLDAFKRACLNALFNSCTSVDEALTK